MFEILDRLAHWWLDHRWQAVKRTLPLVGDFDLTKIEKTVADTGRGWQLSVEMPATVIKVNDVAAVLKQKDFCNHVEFFMLLKSGHSVRPVRVSVQWAQGLGPAGKAAQRPAVRNELRRLLADLSRLLHDAAKA